MTDAAENGATQEQPKAPKMNVMGQYIRDMSFENVAAQTGLQGELQPDTQVQVSLDVKKRSETQYDVGTKLTVTTKNKGDGANIFLLELDYVGIFHIENVPEEQLHPFLLIECPRMTFPFLRRIVSDVTRDGGFMPLSLDNIDFVQLYRQDMARRAQAEAQPQGTA